MYKPGDWLALCESCQFEKYASELRKRWDGFMVCEECWEPRHPLDFLKVKPETAFPSFINKEDLPTITLTTDPIVVTVTVYDSNNDPVVGILPNIVNTNPHIAATSTPTVTNAFGQSTFTVQPSSVGQTKIAAEYGEIYTNFITYNVVGE